MLYRILDSISSTYLNKWLEENNKTESSINNCVILISKDTSKVHINVPTVLEMVSKKDLEKGDSITKDDIADIRRVHLEGVELNSYLGIIYIFSYKWRKCIYFDYLPLLPDNLQTDEQLPEITNFDLESLFATFFANIIFPEIYRMDQKIADKLFVRGWFPFIRILGWRFSELYVQMENDFPIENVEIKIIDSFSKDHINNCVESWMNKEIFKEHEIIIKTAIERFLEADYISAIHILYPRIEGLMRYLYLGTKDKPSQNKLVGKLTEIAKEKNPDSCLFMPDIFNKYIKNFYFNNFNLEKEELDLSRNSIGHGVVSQEELNKVKAFQGFLILDQIYYYV